MIELACGLHSPALPGLVARSSGTLGGVPDSQGQTALLLCGPGGSGDWRASA